MSAFLTPPCQYTFENNNVENEIRKIFFQHWEKMKHQLETTAKAIETWRLGFIEHVNTYANEQLRILADDYDRQRPVFDRKYEENLDTTRAYYDAQNAELFRELHSACLALEFQVAQLEHPSTWIHVPKVITVHEQMERIKTESSNTLKPEEKPIVEPTNNIPDNHRNNDNVSNNSASSISNETQPRHPSVTESSNDKNQSIGNTDGSQARTKSDDSSTTKCPICFMIFPFNMTQDDPFSTC